MYQSIRHLGKTVTKLLPAPLKEAARKAESFTRSMATGGALFEALDFYYVGPIDGHNLDHLVPVLKNVRNITDRPVLVHVVTAEGQRFRAGGRGGGQATRCGEVRRGHRPAEQTQGQCPELPERIRRRTGEARRA